MKSFALLVFHLIVAFVDAKEGPPSAKPLNVNVQKISESTLRLTWSLTFNDYWNNDITGYHILYKRVDSDPSIIESKVLSINCPDRNCRMDINNLEESTEYSFVVSAYNHMGPGPESDLVKETTAGGIPGDLHCEAISSTELRVSWRGVSSGSHSTLRGYKVTYVAMDEFHEREDKTTSTNETVLDGLKKNTKYRIKVSALRSIDDDAQSSMMYCNTEEDVPDEITDLKVLVYGTEKVKLLWHPPSSQDSGETVHYTIHYRKSGGEVKTGKVMASETSYEIFGLEPNVPYEFWVTANSRVGEGPALQYLFGTPSNETPAQIATYSRTFAVKFRENVTLSCDAVGSPKPNVIWKANGVIPNERLQILANGSLFIQNVVREDANKYTCIAMNAFGNDSITHNLTVRAPPKSPEVTILSTTMDEITLEVKPNRTDSASGGRFKIYYKLDSEIEHWQQDDVALNQTYKIAHCKCGSAYQIYAFGYNFFGSGDHSEILVVKTNGSKPIAPTNSNFLEPSVNAVTLHFSSWTADSCPISHFSVAFRKNKSIGWTLVRKKFRPDTEFVLNLEAATLHDIRVTAHNIAGDTVADYEVTTLTENGTIAPSSNITNLPEIDGTINQIE